MKKIELPQTVAEAIHIVRVTQASTSIDALDPSWDIAAAIRVLIENAEALEWCRDHGIDIVNYDGGITLYEDALNNNQGDADGGALSLGWGTTLFETVAAAREGKCKSW